ncbi:MAG: hypothetical protein PUC33_02185 [Oscillospiraceae bacterium]|nr:hypothetical protein [Oscillospiraceae bacterium]
MKKIISLFLSLLLICTALVPLASASDKIVVTGQVDVYETKGHVPVIRILGDGEPLYDADGNKIFHLRSILDGDTGSDSAKDDDNSQLLASVANVLLPFLIEGLLNDEWDAYYENLEKEVGELFDDAKLDKDGNPVNGTGISKERQEYMANAIKRDTKIKRGYYDINDYRFWYDWRLDPRENAMKLNKYIDEVIAITGCPKVSIIASCIGTIVTTTYVQKFGVDKIHGIAFTGSVANGSEMLSECISGRFDTDGNAINRILMDCAYTGFLDLDPFVNASIDLVVKTGLFDLVENDIRDKLYDKLVAGVTSALALSTFYTWPCYWAAVTKEDYPNALNYVFGPEGSEKRQEYAGLIAKLNGYHEEVRLNIDTIVKSIGEGGANFGVISKYGFQLMPICESYDAVGDQFVSVNRASYGATSSTIYDTLSKEYIASKDPAYISPDKQIDASTCLLPENVWFVKNSSHSKYSTPETKILYEIVEADRQLTVDDFDVGRFSVYDYDTNTLSKMTTENCDTEQWETNIVTEKPQNWIERLLGFLTALFAWLEALIKFV